MCHIVCVGNVKLYLVEVNRNYIWITPHCIPMYTGNASADITNNASRCNNIAKAIKICDIGGSYFVHYFKVMRLHQRWLWLWLGYLGWHFLVDIEYIGYIWCFGYLLLVASLSAIQRYAGHYYPSHYCYPFFNELCSCCWSNCVKCNFIE